MCFTVLDVVAAASRQVPRPGRQLRRDGGVGADPVGERVLAVLDDGLASFISVIGLAGLAGGDRGVIDQLEQVLAVADDDGHLLAVLPQSIELVRVRGLDLLAGDVGKLGLSDQGLSLGADELLLENDDLGGVGLLVLELGDLVGDLLLACVSLCQTRSGCGGGGARVRLRSRLGCTEASMFLTLLIVTRYWS